MSIAEIREYLRYAEVPERMPAWSFMPKIPMGSLLGSGLVEGLRSEIEGGLDTIPWAIRIEGLSIL